MATQYHPARLVFAPSHGDRQKLTASKQMRCTARRRGEWQLTDGYHFLELWHFYNQLV